MKKKTKRGVIYVLAVAGIALMVLSFIELWLTPNALQYVALPGDPPMNGAHLEKQRDQIVENLTDAAAGAAFSAVQSQMRLSVQDRTADATLYAIGEGWFEIYPRFITWGRRINETELREGGRVAVLDEKLAFALFGDPLPETMRLDLLGHSYRVVGTVRHAGSVLGGRGVGDEQDSDLYIPLVTALQDEYQPTLELLSVIPGAIHGADAQFLAAARSVWRQDGQLINLRKEAMRRTILPRVAFLFFGLYVLALLTQYMSGFGQWLRDGYRRRLSHSYFRSIWPRLVGVVLLHILGYGIIIALASLLVVFSAQPITVFTEWVPENIVSWSSISQVFWNLVRDAAAPVRLGTREYRVIAFWGGTLRWGTVLLLIASSMPYSRFERATLFLPDRGPTP